MLAKILCWLLLTVIVYFQSGDWLTARLVENERRRGELIEGDHEMAQYLQVQFIDYHEMAQYLQVQFINDHEMAQYLLVQFINCHWNSTYMYVYKS